MRMAGVGMSGSIPLSNPPLSSVLTRRSFLGGVAGGGMALAMPAIAAEDRGTNLAARPAGDWSTLATEWERETGVINLENGGVQGAPRRVTEAFLSAWRHAQVNAARTLARDQWPEVETIRNELASAFGCSAAEIALTRNTTEAVETVLLGLELRPGDRVLTTTRDYWRFQDTLRQRAARDGIVVDIVRLPDGVEGDAAVVAAIMGAVRERTRLALFSQVINLTGRVLPVPALCAALRSRGVLSLVDGAHGFAQLLDTAVTLGCDFYGTSLHKWLGAPHGTGFLYVRRERITQVWPHFPAPEAMRENIRKFESLGTMPAAPFLGIRAALQFWREVGPEVKLARLRWLRERWLGPVMQLPGVSVIDRPNSTEGSALATVVLEGIKPGEVARWLWDRHRVIVRAIEHPEFSGIRVTPNLANNTPDLDRLVGLLDEARQKLRVS
jgi:isopenicillin-N epimerase